MITAEDIQRLMKLKEKDRAAFHRLLGELQRSKPFDVLLSHKKFKDYASNV